MLLTIQTFEHENKCVNCGKGRLKHRATDKACPLSNSKWVQFNEKGQNFVDSGKPTIQSVRKYAALVDADSRARFAREMLEKERSKVRAMTFEEVITATCKLLTEKTGLGIIVERVHEWYAEIHLTTLGGGIVLGFTSVSKYSNGSYGVGGTSSGCFMGNYNGRDLSSLLKEDFKKLEAKASEENNE